MQKIRSDNRFYLPLIVCLLFAAGSAFCSPDQKAAPTQTASPQSSISGSNAARSAVLLETVGIPAAWMSKAKDPSTVIHLSASPAGCHTGADCIQIRYTAGSTWAGIVWWPSSCGEDGKDWRRATSGSCATDVLAAGNLRMIDKVSFWARGEKGGEVAEFRVGNNTLRPVPGRSSGPVTLTAEWKRYEIGLAGLDMRKAVGLFIWIATDLHNPNGATFYLDDVQFEGTK
jgi:hypothetical protein